MPMSEKQKQILRFPYMPQYDAIICDGAVRSGKTSWMSQSFVLWAMGSHDRQNFAICSKSVGAAERNIIRPLMGIKYLRDNFELRYNRSSHEMIVRRGSRENRFYIFGGRDESSASLIQGLTAAGALLDEVALMPRSFVEQTLARCSVEGAKLWFSCNPEGPRHWFYQTWILQAKKMRALHLHFTLDDNPGLSADTKAQYEAMYTGTFYERFILGRWVLAEGLIYPKVNASYFRDFDVSKVDIKYCAIDFGTDHPTVMVFGGIMEGNKHDWRIVAEYYDEKSDKTTYDHYVGFLDMCKKLGADPNRVTIAIDPAAKVLRQEFLQHGLACVRAINDVLPGIDFTRRAIYDGVLSFHASMKMALKQFGSYSWDPKASERGEDKPIKIKDDIMDAIRYFGYTFVRPIMKW